MSTIFANHCWALVKMGYGGGAGLDSWAELAYGETFSPAKYAVLLDLMFRVGRQAARGRRRHNGTRDNDEVDVCPSALVTAHAATVRFVSALYHDDINQHHPQAKRLNLPLYSLCPPFLSFGIWCPAFLTLRSLCVSRAD